jgi:hypothetical protein
MKRPIKGFRDRHHKRGGFARKPHPQTLTSRFHNQTNGIRRNEQASNGPRTSGGFPSSPCWRDAAGVTNATPGGRGKNHKVSAPAVAPNVPGQQGTPLQGGGPGGNPRNPNKHAQGGDQNLPPDAAGVTNAPPGGRGKNHKVSAPTVAPNVPGQQGTAHQGGGPGGTPRNPSKHAQGGDQGTCPTRRSSDLTPRQEAEAKTTKCPPRP